MKRWQDVPGVLSIELNPSMDGTFYDAQTDKPLSDDLQRALASHPDAGELVIEFLSNGYDDPGYLGGLPEQCYPPEGDEERVIQRAYVTVWTPPEGGRMSTTTRRELTPDELQLVEAACQWMVDELELEPCGD